MKLIIILIATAAEKFLGDVIGQFRKWRELGWYHKLVGMVEQKFGSIEVLKGPVGVGAMLALPIIAYFLLNSILGGIHGVFAFLFTIVVLWYCLGPRDLDSEVGAVVAAVRSGDEAEANRLAQALAGAETPVTSESRGRAVVESILTEANERWFGVLFWFALLGPIGALLFRFSSELRRYAARASSGMAEWAGCVRNVLVWVPARLAALGYAISGSLTGAFQQWRVFDTLTLQQSDLVLTQSGIGALQLHADGSNEVERVTAALDLVMRTLIILIGLLVLVYLIGWIT
jgi:membrane protein required for beta-lactamase induction